MKAKELKNRDNWKDLARWHNDGYYELSSEDIQDVPVRLFLTPKLLEESEVTLYEQIVNATQFPETKLVVITPDTHYGYGVPVGCVLLTDGDSGAIAMGPVGFDIGCFAADTLVPTIDGKSYPIGDLAKSNKEVYIYAMSSEKQIVVAKGTAKRTRGGAKLLKVVLDNNREIICTPDHKFMLRDGTYAEAQNLLPKTSLMPFNKSADKDGYVLIGQPKTWKRDRAHWIVANSGILGDIPSFDNQKTIIHHKNFDIEDNRPENLEFMGDRNHQRYHKSIKERSPHFQSPEFEEKRKAALAAKAATPEGHAYFAARGSANFEKYRKENPDIDRINAIKNGNGERGKSYLVAYNQSEEGKAKSSEIGKRKYNCETCNEEVTGGLGLHLHRKSVHGYNHKVISVQFLDYKEDVYCLTVPEYGNFALDAGVFVHNCGMVSAKSNVDVEKATPKKRLEFNQAVMKRINMGAGGLSTKLKNLQGKEFNELIRGGAEYYVSKYGANFDRGRAERHRMPVDDDWQPPLGGKGRPERGMAQLGSLGGGKLIATLTQ